jgi:hypothetical protein
MWFYQRYKYQIPKSDLLKNSYYPLPNPILKFIHKTFNITHSYFSCLVTCSTTITSFFSPFPRDTIFGFLGTAFQHKWLGIGFAHLHTIQDAQQSMHWARLAAQNDPSSLTILVIPDTHWYQKFTPLNGPFDDTNTIIHFDVDSITYNEPTIPMELHKTPRKESSAIHIYCIHHQQNPLFTEDHIKQFIPLLNILNIHNTKL